MSHKMVHGREPTSPPDSIVIGVVTNTTPAAMRMTERQFRYLISRAAPAADVELRFFIRPDQLPHVAKATAFEQYYASLDAVFGARLDALIVTGAEPQAASMLDEPYWPTLARLVEWAADHTVSAIWSCLAAHAAVFKLDGLVRRTFPEKLSGVFECFRVFDHSLVADAPPSWRVPHSRYNDLNEDDLVANGYRILSRAPRVGADAFVKHVNESLFLFLQGHPEYDSESLLHEYRRDVRRFLAGKQKDYPDLPAGYFSQPICRALTELRDRVSQMEQSEVTAEMDVILEAPPEHSWHEQAAGLFSRWLQYIGNQKSLRGRAGQLPEPHALMRHG